MFNEVVNELKADKLIINTIQDRLYITGRTANGTFLKTDQSYNEGRGNVYAKKTISYKKESNHPYSNVTLSDSGEFYDSFKVDFTSKEIILSANFKKGDKDISENFRYTFNDERFKKEILSLTAKEKKVFSKLIVTKLVQKILNTLTNGF